MTPEKTRLHPEEAIRDEENQLGGVLTSIGEKMRRIPKEAKFAVAAFVGVSMLAIGEGAMREAHGQMKLKGGSAVEDVSRRYMQETQRVHEQYQKETEQSQRMFEETGRKAQQEMERVREEGTREADQYRHQKEIEVNGPGIHIRARQGSGGKGPRESLTQERRSLEPINELAMRTLRLLYDLPDRAQAKHLIEDFARHTGQDVGDAAEMLSADIPRLINRLRNAPDDSHDSAAFDRFMKNIKAHPGIQEILDTARFKIAPRPRGSSP